MGTIPKYVYEDIKNKAKTNLSNANREIYEHFKDELNEIGQSIVNKEIDNLNIKLSYKSYIHSNYYAEQYNTPISGDIDIHYTLKKEDLKEKILKAQKKITDKMNKMQKDLNYQYDTWILDIFSKASDGQSITIPDFKVDYSKY